MFLHWGCSAAWFQKILSGLPCIILLIYEKNGAAWFRMELSSENNMKYDEVLRLSTIKYDSVL